MEERFITTESAAKMRLRTGNNLVLTGTAAIWLQQLLLADSRGRAALASMHVPVAGSLCGLLAGLLPVGYALWAEFLQKQVSRFGFYTLGHLAGVAAVLLLTPWAASRMLSLPFCLIILTVSYYARIHERLLIYPSPMALVPGLLLYLAAAFMGRTDLGVTAFLGELCSGILLLLYRGQDSLETALDQIPKGGTVPYDRIRQAYARSMGKWVGAGAAAAGLLNWRAVPSGRLRGSFCEACSICFRCFIQEKAPNRVRPLQPCRSRWRRENPCQMECSASLIFSGAW